MKIPAGTIKELPIGTFFRHDSNAGFIVVSSNRAKCIFSKSSLLTKDETYRIAFNDDIYISDEESMKVALL